MSYIVFIMLLSLSAREVRFVESFGHEEEYIDIYALDEQERQEEADLQAKLHGCETEELAQETEESNYLYEIQCCSEYFVEVEE